MKRLLSLTPLVSATFAHAQKFENPALTPPLGWNRWNKFQYPETEQLLCETADAMLASGMTARADDGHSQGLKPGLYSDAGWKTCGGRPGSRGRGFQEAQTTKATLAATVPAQVGLLLQLSPQ